MAQEVTLVRGLTKHLIGSGSWLVVGCEVAPLLRVVEWWGGESLARGRPPPAGGRRGQESEVSQARRRSARHGPRCRSTDQDTAAANLCHPPPSSPTTNVDPRPVPPSTPLQPQPSGVGNSSAFDKKRACECGNRHRLPFLLLGGVHEHSIV